MNQPWNQMSGGAPPPPPPPPQQQQPGAPSAATQGVFAKLFGGAPAQ